MKKKMLPNLITRWLGRWVSQTRQLENSNTILDAYSVSEHLISKELESFKFEEVIYC